MGALLVPLWDEVIRYQYQIPLQISEPIFGKDVSFYLFSLPIYDYLSLWLKALVWITAIGGAFLYNFYYNRDHQTMLKAKRGIIIHGTMLGLLALLVSAARSQIDIWKLLYSERGVTFGAGYTDVQAQIPAYHIHMGVLAVIGLILLINLFLRRRRLWIGGAIVWISSYVLVVWLYPNIYQILSVRPNELSLEKEYIKYNIEFTRKGFGLDGIKESQLVNELATLDKVKSQPAILTNIQLWDRRALHDSLAQLQEIRPYYSFPDTDVDRYWLNGQYRQVMLAAREVNVDKLPQYAQNWVNRRLIFTHGYGVCATPVNQFTPEGRPSFWAKDIPPKSSFAELNLTRPEVYFGELTKGHVFLNSGIDEFDYPAGEGNRYNRYDGKSGIKLGQGFGRLALSARFGGLKLFLSRYISSETKVVFRRQILERAKAIAPFLSYDQDPYIVIGNSGRLYWIIDTYVTSKNYPFSEPYGQYNYIRDPIKVVVDAYNGSVDFYVWDENEIITQIYSKAFQGLFKSKKEVPDGLANHVRYPDELTNIQAFMYATYHMSDPQVFYNQEDRWELPYEIYYHHERKIMTPYYTVLKLPGEEKEEFVNMIPFTPTAGKRNMIAWLVARCDEPHYGELLVYTLPKGEIVDGPEMVEARIDSDTEISQKLTLWNQQGSMVIRGNLLVIPIENSLFYVEPLYLQAQNSKMPELKQVIVAAGDRLAWGETFEAALEKVFVGQVAALPPQNPNPSSNPGSDPGANISSNPNPPPAQNPVSQADKADKTDKKVEKTEKSEKKPNPKRNTDEIVKSAKTNLEQYKKLFGEGKMVEAAKAFEALQKDINELSEVDR
jgi:uncharacterized membrane protein (UPF0182 family)